MLSYLQFVLFVLFIQCLKTTSAATGCIWQVPIGPKPQFTHFYFYPLIFHSDTTDFNYPIRRAGDKLDVEVKFQQSIDIICPESQIVGLNIPKLKATCGSNKQFQFSVALPADFDLNNIHCANQPTALARPTGRKCNRHNDINEIEFGVQIDALRFLRFYTSCFDEIGLNAVYTHHKLVKSIKAKQHDTTREPKDESEEKKDDRIKFRPPFKPDFFPQHIFVYGYYTKATQKRTIEFLTQCTHHQGYIHDSRNLFLSRSHLTSKTDFVYTIQQHSTMYYVNAAPQWQIINSGNWNSAEEALHDYVTKSKNDLEIYTGTYGTLKLENCVTKSDVELYLYNENGEKQIQVPELIWKIAYSEETKAAIVIISLNNPYNSIPRTICPDITSQINWLSKKIQSSTNDFMYSCSYQDAKEAFGNINFPDIKVNAILRN